MGGEGLIERTEFDCSALHDKTTYDTMGGIFSVRRKSGRISVRSLIASSYCTVQTCGGTECLA
jgi:hypothetical protein